MFPSDRQIPTILSYVDGEEYYGQQAKNFLIRNPNNTVAYFRDFLGKEFKSISSAGSEVMGGIACNGWRFWSVEGQNETPAPYETSKPKPAKPVKKPAAKAPAKRPAAAGKKAGEVTDQPPVAPFRVKRLTRKPSL